MFEIQLLSLFVGSLGLQAVFLSGWVRWRQVAVDGHWEEEELLTPYESKGTPVEAEFPQRNGASHALRDSAREARDSAREARSSGWEFKIVRANADLFRNPKVFQRLCDEEAQAGWMLLEKLDDRRVRFKRPLAVRDLLKPETLLHDPYRTRFGPSASWTTLLMAIAFLTATLLPAYLGYALVSATLKDPRLQHPAIPLPPSPKPTASPVEPPSSRPLPSRGSELAE